jgi:hypothetical protein
VVIEVVTLRLKPGTDESAFLAAVERSTEFLARQPGFLRREVGVTGDGEWADIVHWSDLDAALRAAAAFNAAPETGAFNTCLEGGSVRLRHFRTAFRSDQGRMAPAAREEQRRAVH